MCFHFVFRFYEPNDDNQTIDERKGRAMQVEISWTVSSGQFNLFQSTGSRLLLSQSAESLSKLISDLVIK